MSTTILAENSALSVKPASLLDRARALLKKTSLAVVPLAAAVAATDAQAQTPGMTSDYSVVGSQTSSGWFTDRIVLSESDASATSAGTVTQISGSRSITDGFFWQYDSYYQETRPGYDTTGLRFMWGGQLHGGAMSGDSLSSIIKFSIAFTTTNEAYPTVNYNLQLSYGSNAYTPDYYSNPSYGWDNYNSSSDSLSSAGTFELEKTLSTTFYSDWDGESPKYWSLFLDVHWNSEFVSARNWSSGNYSKLNGDTFAVTLPEGFSSVSFNSTAAAIPEPAHFAGIFGLLAAGLLCWRRRAAKLAA